MLRRIIWISMYCEISAWQNSWVPADREQQRSADNGSRKQQRTWVPADRKQQRSAEAVCPSKVRRQVPSARLHSRTVLSPLAVATACSIAREVSFL